MKKQLFLKICAVAAISTMMLACKKSEVAKQSILNNSKTNVAASPLLVPNVYVSGYTSTSSVAKYWLNTNPPVFLPTTGGNSFANDLDVSSTGDVYIVGTDGTSESGAKVWKNGAGTALPIPAGATHGAVARAVYINGSDVYIAGYTWFTGSDQRATYWKLTGGSTSSITTTVIGSNPSAAYGITVTTAGDIYIAGTTLVSGVGGTNVYWVNGVQTNIAGGTISGGRPQILSIGNDVYYATATNVLTSPRSATMQLFKNGAPLSGYGNGPTYSISTFSLATDGANLYVEYAGTSNPSASTVTLYVWNGPAASPTYTINSSGGTFGSSYNCLSVDPSTGVSYVVGHDGFIACYWANGGTKTNLTSSTNDIPSAIVVK